MIPVVEMPNPKPTSDNSASSEGNRRTIGEWFRIVMPKRSDNRTPRQTRSETPPQSGIPSQTKATPRNEQPSTMAPGKRVRVSVPFSIDTGNRYLTIRLSGRLEGPLLDDGFVHASHPFMNILPIVTHRRKQPSSSLRRVNRPRPLRTQKLVSPTSRMKRRSTT